MTDLIERLRFNADVLGRGGLHSGLAVTIREAAAALEAAREDGWQPIETAMPEGDMHRALDWVRTHCVPCSIEEHSYLDAIEEAVAAYDPARVGADTVRRAAMPTELERAKELRDIGSAIVEALAQILKAPQTDEQFDADVIPRSFVIDQVSLIKEQYDKLVTIAAALQAQQPGAQAVAYAVQLADGSIGALGWQGMGTHDWCQKFLVLREGARYVYAYTHPQPPSIPEPSEEDVRMSCVEWEVAINSGNAVLFSDLIRSLLTTYTARLRERIGGRNG